MMAADTSSPKISLALGKSRKLPTSTKTNGLKRPHSALLGDGEDEHDDSGPQDVSMFDRKAGGAISNDRPKAKGPLVITAIKNRDWKEASKQKRQRSDLPRQEQHAQRIADLEELEKRENNKTFGLTFAKQVEIDGRTPDDEQDATATDDAPTKPLSADEQAMNALLGKKENSTLVVPAITETEAFQDGYKSAPDMASLEDYARVPVEEFGAAMLRGMGWKEGEGVGTNKGVKPKKSAMPERRPALLGIGAKADAAMNGELGGWGKAARGKDSIYNPLLLKNKKTGEMMTEEELQQQKEQARLQQYEQEFEEQERSKRKDTSRSERHDRDRRRDEDRHERRKHDDRHDRDERDERPRKHRHDRYEDDRRSNAKHDSDRTSRKYDDDNRRRDRGEREGKHSRRDDEDRRHRRERDDYDDRDRHRSSRHDRR